METWFIGMMRWAILCLILALLAGILRFLGMVGLIQSIATLAFGLLLMLGISLFIAGLFLGGRRL